jgi:hypothetical protein
MTSKTTAADRPVYGYTVQTQRGCDSSYAHIYVKLFKLDYTYTSSDGGERECWTSLCELRGQAHRRTAEDQREVTPKLRFGFDAQDSRKLREGEEMTAWYAFKLSDVEGSNLESQWAALVEVKALTAKAEKAIAKFNLGYKHPDVVDCFVAGLNTSGVRYMVYDDIRHGLRQARDFEIPWHIAQCK